MQPLIASRSAAPAGPQGEAKKIKRDPAPSRWSYRVHRMWLTPIYRKLLRVGLPVFLVLTMTGWYISNPTNRFMLEERFSEIRTSIENRPEFAVKMMAVEGATPVVDAAIRDMIPIEFPESSFDIDLEVIQAQISELDVVRDVAVRIRPGGVLEIAVEERVPAVLWRAHGTIDLLDRTGHRVASVTSRSARGDLPLLAGDGANDRVDEALAIIDAADPIAGRLRGLVRVGHRRWDVVLDRSQVIQLPEKSPVAALEQVLALDEAQDLLARDLTYIDMRNPARPTLRMAQPAVDELRHVRSLQSGDN